MKNNYNPAVLANQKKILIIISGIEEFKNKLSMENQNKLNDFFTKVKNLGIINYLIIDSVDNVKKFEYESWFKDSVNLSDGIWIGDGINDQFTLKVSVRTDEVRESVDDDFCFVLKRGKPVLVKYVREFETKLDSEDEMLEID